MLKNQPYFEYSDGFMTQMLFNMYKNHSSWLSHQEFHSTKVLQQTEFQIVSSTLENPVWVCEKPKEYLAR